MEIPISRARTARLYNAEFSADPVAAHQEMRRAHSQVAPVSFVRPDRCGGPNLSRARMACLGLGSLPVTFTPAILPAHQR
jgi:hypothetical protein